MWRHRCDFKGEAAAACVVCRVARIIACYEMVADDGWSVGYGACCSICCGAWGESAAR